MAQSGGGGWRRRPLDRLIDRHRAADYLLFSDLLAPPHPTPPGDDSSSDSSSDMEDPPVEFTAVDPARGGGAPAPPFTRAVPPPLELTAAHPPRGGGAPAPPFTRAVPPRLELPAAHPARGGGAPPFARAGLPLDLIRAPGAGPRARLDLAPRRFRCPLGVAVGGVANRRLQADGVVRERGGAALPGVIYNALEAIRPRLDRADLLRAYSALVRDDRRFRSLMALPEDMRKEWLLMEVADRAPL